MENKEDLYVIGFPKSGNTWLARILSDITNSKIYVESEKDIINNSENRDDKKGNFLIHKIHATNKIDEVMKAKKIYILRDPRAVMVSGFFHNHRHITEKQIKQSFFYRILFEFEIKNLNTSWNNTIAHYINTLKSRLKGDFLKYPKVGNWSEHVNYWTNIDNIVVVTYEDLLENTFKELKKILDELDISYTDEELNKVIENQSFLKKKKEFLEKGDMKNAKFLRSAKKESWRKLLTPKLQKKIEKTHQDMMKKFGYKID